MTIIAYGAIVSIALCVEKLKEEKIDVEVIDLQNDLAHGCWGHHYLHSKDWEEGSWFTRLPGPAGWAPRSLPKSMRRPFSLFRPPLKGNRI